MKAPVLNTPQKQEEWWSRFAAWRREGRAVQWCAFLKESGKYVGLFTIKEIDMAHYRGELGYSVLKEEWGKGIGGEGARHVVDYAFRQIGIHRLFAMIMPYNIPSQRIVKSLGFEQEAHFKDMHFYQGKFYDMLQFSLINAISDSDDES